MQTTSLPQTGTPRERLIREMEDARGGDIDWRVMWRQGGTHTRPLALPGFPTVPATNKTVKIPEHFFYYRVTDEAVVEIRPDPVPGGAPRGIFEQIGVELPPL